MGLQAVTGIGGGQVATLKSEIQAVVTRDQALPGGLKRQLTYWLCWDGLGSGAGTYHVKCHCLDRQAGRIMRETVVVSGDLGGDRTQAMLVFTLLTSVEVPIAPERLQHVTQDMMRRNDVATRPTPGYQQLNLVARSSALNLLAKLQSETV